MPRRSLPSLPPFLRGVLQSTGIAAAFVALGLASAGLVSLLEARIGVVEETGRCCLEVRPAGGAALPAGPSGTVRAIRRGNPHPTPLKSEADRDCP